MKKLFFILSLVLPVLSCTKQEPLPVEARSFSVLISDSPSKVQMASDKSLVWTEGDRISVFGSPTNECYSFDGKTGDNSGSISKIDSKTPAAEFSKYYAIYPYSESTTCTSEGNFTVSLPAVQHYCPGSVGVGANLMAAVSSGVDGKTLKFYNVCGYLRLKIRSALPDLYVKSVKLSANGAAKLSGTGNLTLKDGEAPRLEMSKDASSVITLDCGDKGVLLSMSEADPTEFFFVLPAQTLAGGFTITVTAPDGSTFYKSTLKDLTIVRSDVCSMASFAYAPADITVNGTKITADHNLYGLITDSTTGAGIPGVPVSDGFNYVATDENGVYQMTAHNLCRKVYYSLPSGYKVNTDPETGLPVFFSSGVIDPSVPNRNDFVLTPDNSGNTKLTFITVGDPQVKTEENIARYSSDCIPDIRSYVSAQQLAGNFTNPIAMTLGDVVFNTPELFPAIKASMSNLTLDNGVKVPFYQTIGNHDHNGGADEYESREYYMDTFGPVDYSFNVGKVHVVSMDDIIVTSPSSALKWSYVAGILDEQLEWLRQDLSYVENKEDKVILLCVHAPFGSKAKTNSREGNNTRYVQDDRHYQEVLSLLSEFYDARIYSGHTHTLRNSINRDYICKSGRPVIEHNPGAACGGWWSTKLNPDGTFSGYLVTEIEGNIIKDWKYKVFGRSQSLQMRVYDGNLGTGGCYWYNSSNTFSPSTYVGNGYSEFKNSFVVSLFIGDSENWALELYQNDMKVGDLIRVPDSVEAEDIWTGAFFFGTAGLTSKYYAYNEDTMHYWYIKAPNSDPSSYKNWYIKATHTIPASGIKHVYRATKLKKDFSGFAYDTSESDPEPEVEPGKETETNNGNEGYGTQYGEW